MKKESEILVNILRSGMIESRHLGSIAVVDHKGSLLAEYGDADLRAFIRSSAKPLQAIPTFADADCMKHYKFNSRERAYLVASHNGEKRHLKIGERLQEKLGITNSDLLCGIHPPLHGDTARQMFKDGVKFTELCNNCSGNHMVMIALSLFRKWGIKDYVNPYHP